MCGLDSSLKERAVAALQLFFFPKLKMSTPRSLRSEIAMLVKLFLPLLLLLPPQASNT